MTLVLSDQKLFFIFAMYLLSPVPPIMPLSEVVAVQSLHFVGTNSKMIRQRPPEHAQRPKKKIGLAEKVDSPHPS